MTTTYRATGKITSSLKKPDSDQNWWMVLDDISENLGRYYRNLYFLDHNKGKKLCKPYWGAHVTIVRNEIPPNLAKWWDYHEEEVEFEYIPGVRDNFGPERYRSFFWLDVRCPRFDEIRAELGLPPNPDRTYHVTIGSIEDERNRAAYEAMWE